jgi:hypothetical protein
MVALMVSGSFDFFNRSPKYIAIDQKYNLWHPSIYFKCGLKKRHISKHSAARRHHALIKLPTSLIHTHLHTQQVPKPQNPIAP